MRKIVLTLCLALASTVAHAQTAPDWRKPLACDLPSGKRLPARNANLDIDGAGRGTIGVYIYGREIIEPNRVARLGPDDIGATMDFADELSGAGKFCRVVNAPAELLDSSIYDPGSGRMRLVTEIEARRREQAAASGGQAPAPISGKFLVTVNPDGSATIARQ